MHTTSRRSFLAGASGLLAAGTLSAKPALTGADQAVERAHDVFWKRFVDKQHGTLYDYAPMSGPVLLPTPEECRDMKPNALGWWSPIENGGFFGGLYLGGLCDRWKRLKTREAADAARTVAGGLVKLAEVGSTPGFIARGVSADGKSHYTASSSDQTYPWFYGMFSYLTSGIVKGKERDHLVRLVERVVDGLEKNEWRIPCDRENFGNFGDWAGAFSSTRTTLTGAEPHFDAASRLLFVHLAMCRITGKKRWLDLYRQRRDEKPNGSGKSRLDICAGGVEYAPPATPARYPDHPPLWTSASSQAALKALLQMDPDTGAKAEYQKGLSANASRAAEYVGRYRLFDNEDTRPFRHDWRVLNDLWKPQASIAEAVTLATRQYREWNKVSPRKVYECDNVRDPLFSAWVVALSGDRQIIEKSRKDITAAIGHYAWSRMQTAHFFMAECAWYALGS
jgi:hypothetical protein